jgi:DNA mismatch repair protein MutL
MVVTDLNQRIHKLSIALANQIAAGEVIQRPASVVKELLENSLDAGATEIKIDIKKGGRLLISIQDNGHGIHPDDLPLALAQHATSKLNTQTDLEKINTLGFRGEALSSIASVSRLKLASRIADENHGWSIDVTPGDVLSEQAPTGMVVGTSVEVRDLFFNTPARRKFLRTDNTEFFHIREIVRRIALSQYDVSFHLKHNNKTILQCPARQNSSKQNNFAERAQSIFGKNFLSNSFELNYERNGLRLWGWFGHPEIARNQVDQQYFYLNGRVIRDKQVNHAIRMAM